MRGWSTESAPPLHLSSPRMRNLQAGISYRDLIKLQHSNYAHSVIHSSTMPQYLHGVSASAVPSKYELGQVTSFVGILSIHHVTVSMHLLRGRIPRVARHLLLMINHIAVADMGKTELGEQGSLGTRACTSSWSVRTRQLHSSSPSSSYSASTSIVRVSPPVCIHETVLSPESLHLFAGPSSTPPYPFRSASCYATIYPYHGPLCVVDGDLTPAGI